MNQQGKETDEYPRGHSLRARFSNPYERSTASKSSGCGQLASASSSRAASTSASACRSSSVSAATANGPVHARSFIDLTDDAAAGGPACTHAPSQRTSGKAVACVSQSPLSTQQSEDGSGLGGGDGDDDNYAFLPDDVLIRHLDEVERVLECSRGRESFLASDANTRSSSGAPFSHPEKTRKAPDMGGEGSPGHKRQRTAEAKQKDSATPLTSRMSAPPHDVAFAVVGLEEEAAADSAASPLDVQEGSCSSSCSLVGMGGASLTQMVEEEQSRTVYRDSDSQRIKSHLLLQRNSIEHFLRDVFDLVRSRRQNEANASNSTRPLGDKPWNLNGYIQALRRVGVLSDEFFSCLEFFRVRGNDAAHDDGRRPIPTRPQFELQMKNYGAMKKQLQRDLEMIT